MEGLTLEQQIAQLLGLSVADTREILNRPGQDLEGLQKTIEALNDNIDNIDDKQIATLRAGLQKDLQLLNKQGEQLGATSQQPAKAAAATGLSNDLAELAATLQQQVTERADTRSTAFKNVYQKQLLDQSTPGRGDRAARTQRVLSEQLDAITNGTIAAEELATDGSLFGFLARSVVGNPFQEGVEAAKTRQDTLAGAYKNVLGAADATFSSTLRKDEPLSESLAAFNAGVTDATQRSVAQRERDLIAPVQAGIDAQVTGLQLAGNQQQTSVANSIANIQRSGVEREIDTSQFLNQQRTAINNNLLTRARGLAQDSVNFIESDANGNPVDTTTFNGQNRANQAINLQTNTSRNLGRFTVEKAAGEFDVVTQVGLTNRARAVTQVQQNAVLLEGIGKGIEAGKPIDPKAVANVRKNYETALKVDEGERIIAAKAAVDAELTANTDAKTRAAAYKAAEAKEQTITKEIANLKTSIDLKSVELDILGKELTAKQKRLPDMNEAEAKKYQAEVIKWGEELTVLQNEQSKLDRIATNQLNTSTARVNAEVNNAIVTDIKNQEERIKFGLDSMSKELQELTTTASPEGKEVKALELENRVIRAELESKQLKEKLEIQNSPEAEAIKKDKLEKAKLKHTVEMAELRQKQKNLPKIATLTDQEFDVKTNELAIKLFDLTNEEQVRNAAADKELARKAEVARNRATILAGDQATAEAKKLAEEGTKYDAIRRAAFIINGREPTDAEIDVMSKPVRDALGNFAGTGSLGADPYAALDTYANSIDGNRRTAMFASTQQDLLAFQQGALQGYKPGIDQGAINTAVSQAIRSPTPVKLGETPSDRKRGLLSIPKKSDLLTLQDGDNKMDVNQLQSIDSVANWDNNSMQTNLSKLKDFYVAQAGDNPDMKLVAVEVANTMASVMRAKGTRGKFDLLGIPKINELRYEVDDTSFLESLFNNNPLGILYNSTRRAAEEGASLVTGKETPKRELPKIDVMSPAGIMTLIDKGII